MRDMKYLYAYKHKQTGNVILTRSVITSKDWELIEDNAKASETTPQQAPQDGAEPAPEESQPPDTTKAEKPAETPAAAKKKATVAAAKKSTGKRA